MREDPAVPILERGQREQDAAVEPRVGHSLAGVVLAVVQVVQVRRVGGDELLVVPLAAVVEDVRDAGALYVGEMQPHGVAAEMQRQVTAGEQPVGDPADVRGRSGCAQADRPRVRDLKLESADESFAARLTSPYSAS